MRLITSILIVFAALITGLTASGQAANQVFDSTNIKGNVNVILTGTKEASIYQGIAGFTFETSHDAATLILQGCYDTDSWYDIDTVIASGATKVKQMVYQTPPKFKYYRLFGDGNSGDTCRVTNARYFLKY